MMANDFDIAHTSLATLKVLAAKPWDVFCLRSSCAGSTIVRVLPTLPPNDNDVGVLCLQPLLYEFLDQSRGVMSSSNESDASSIENSGTRVAITDGSLTSHGGHTFDWTAHRIHNVVDHMPSTQKLTLSLTCICTDSPQTSELISRALEDRFVMDGTVIALPTESGGNALFLVGIEEESSVYRLGPNHQCNIEIHSLPHELITDNYDNESDYKDCPGYHELFEELKTLLQINGKAAPSGVLLTGCAGVGKTRMASCLSRALSSSHVFVHRVSVRDLLLRASWASESGLIRLLLEPSTNRQMLLIVDDLDVLGGEETTEAGGPYRDPEMIVTMNAVLLAIDKVSTRSDRCNVLGIGQEENLLPREITCLGRLEKQVQMIPPTQWQRELILADLLKDVQEQEHIDNWVSALGPITSGCVAADLERLCADAWTRAWAGDSSSLDRKIENVPPISWEHLREAALRCVPSQLAQLDVIKTPAWPQELANDYYKIHLWSFRDFGGYSETKKRLYRTVVVPWRHFIKGLGKNKSDTTAKDSELMGIPPPSGVLFHGPSGTGKTVAASCLACSLGLPVVKVRASQIMDQWLGGSEAIVRSLFDRARAASPCILFFDEIDAIATNREKDNDSGDVSSRLLSTFLNEMDGISSSGGRGGVLVVAASNRMDALDAALLRPGRLEEHVLLSLPTVTDIESILRVQLARVPLDQDVELDKIAKRLAELHSSGADIEGFCRTLCLNATRNIRDSSPVLSIPRVEFENAMDCWHGF